MLLRRLAIENVRSFLDRREMSFDGSISIIIGPNGGGKTNLLDTLHAMLRRHLFATRYSYAVSGPNQETLWELRQNDQLSQLVFERHSAGRALRQAVEIEVEVSQSDIDNMRMMQAEAPALIAGLNRKYTTNPWQVAENWKVEAISPGTRLTYSWVNDQLQQSTPEAMQFLAYLQLYEFDNSVRADLGKASLKLSSVYLPVNRSGGSFQSSIGLAGYNDIDQKRATDVITSRSGGNIVSLAIGRLAQKYRLLQEESNLDAREAFYKDENLIELSANLKELGYEWKLTTIDPLTNSYDITLTKQGSSFLVSAASSGERELLTYLFAIYALNVRDALIIVDEPELHLHPSWQKTLFSLFEKLSKTTGNQFVLATHSPTFVSPASIQYVSRVFIEHQKSNVVRLNAAGLPNPKHLFNVVNSQNNERMFFTDKVVLVEGLSDRIVFERLLTIKAQRSGRLRDSVPEVVSVGGKGLFAAYKMLLEACHVAYVIISDLDYVEQVGDCTVKDLFSVNVTEIKTDVIDNIKSLDGNSLVVRIEEALASGSWDDARETWEYIKSRRRTLRPNLTAPEKAVLQRFLDAKRGEGIFILGRGALEAYLPEGLRDKDLNKLIEYVDSESFWERLPAEGRDELETITKAILG